MELDIIEKARSVCASRQMIGFKPAVRCTISELLKAINASGIPVETWLPGTLIWLRLDHAMNTTCKEATEYLLLNDCLDIRVLAKELNINDNRWTHMIRLRDWRVPKSSEVATFRDYLAYLEHKNALAANKHNS